MGDKKDDLSVTIKNDVPKMPFNMKLKPEKWQGDTSVFTVKYVNPDIRVN